MSYRVPANFVLAKGPAGVSRENRWIFRTIPDCNMMITEVEVANYSDITIYLPQISSMKSPHRVDTLRVYSIEDARLIWEYLLTEHYRRVV